MNRKLSSKEVEGHCLLATLFCTGPVQKAAEKKWLKLAAAKPKRRKP